MIQIDDSGWGSLLGGVYIGIYNTDTNKMYARLIPVSYFQGVKFEKQKYLTKALQIARAGISVLTGDNSDSGIHIQVCRGHILSHIRTWVQENAQHFSKTEFVEIKDPLQTALEKKFSKLLETYGVPEGDAKGAHRISFDAMLKWIKEDPKRIKHVKTGWKSWGDKYGKEM